MLFIPQGIPKRPFVRFLWGVPARKGWEQMFKHIYGQED